MKISRDKGKKEFHISSFRKKPVRPYQDTKKDMGETQNVQQVWDLSEEDTYVQHRRRRGLPRFVAPVIIFLLLTAFLFWLIPGLAARYFGASDGTPEELTAPVRIYSDSVRVVNVYAANLLSAPDIKADRITQLLYNEPVTLMEKDSKDAFVQIQTKDKMKGYVKSADLSDSTDSVEPDLHLFKLIVSDVSKNVMSHASNGTLLMEVMMNTVLFADIKSEGVYQVSLPNGEKGWINSSGVIEVGVEDPVEKVGVRYFVSSVLSYVNMTQLDGGLTRRGLSVEGLVYISAAVNGVTMPRTMTEQIAMGERVDLVYDEVTGLLAVSSIAPGDLVFLRDPLDEFSAAPHEMGICTDTGALIMTSPNRTTLRLVTLEDNEELQTRIIAVRRIFS